jgi:hypothetical protein
MLIPEWQSLDSSIKSTGGGIYNYGGHINGCRDDNELHRRNPRAVRHGDGATEPGREDAAWGDISRRRTTGGVDSGNLIRGAGGVLWKFPRLRAGA